MSYRDDFSHGAREFFWSVPRALVAVLVLIVAVFLLVVVTTPLTIGFGWFQGEANLRSFNHVRQTYAEGYDDVRALDALAANVCVYRADARQMRAVGDENAASQRDSQVLAFEARYNSLRGEYDSYMEDHFRGGVIRPRKLPLPYPTLAERTAALCG